MAGVRSRMLTAIATIGRVSGSRRIPCVRRRRCSESRLLGGSRVGSLGSTTRLSETMCATQSRGSQRSSYTGILPRSKIRSPATMVAPRDPDEADGATAVIRSDGATVGSRTRGHVLRIEARGNRDQRIAAGGYPSQRAATITAHTRRTGRARLFPIIHEDALRPGLTHQAYRRRQGLEICRKLDLPGARNFAFDFLCDFPTALIHAAARICGA